jgi:hypothetical protein
VSLLLALSLVRHVCFFLLQSKLNVAEAECIAKGAAGLPEAAIGDLASGTVWGFELTGGDLGAAKQMAQQFHAYVSSDEPTASLFRTHGLAN